MTLTFLLSDSVTQSDNPDLNKHLTRYLPKVTYLVAKRDNIDFEPTAILSISFNFLFLVGILLEMMSSHGSMQITQPMGGDLILRAAGPRDA